MGVGLAGEVERIHIGHGAGRKHPFKLGPELVPSKGHHRKEALLLPKGQQIHRQLCLIQLHGDVRLQGIEGFQASGLQLQINRTVEQRFPLPLQSSQQGCYIQQVLFRLNRFVDVGVTQLQPVLAVGMVGDLVMLPRFHQTVVYPQRDAAVVCQVGQDRLLLGTGWIFPDCPHTAVGITHDVMVWKKPDRGRANAVKEGLGLLRCRLLWGKRFLLKQSHLQPPVHTVRHPHPGAYHRPWWSRSRFPAAA